LQTIVEPVEDTLIALTNAFDTTHTLSYSRDILQLNYTQYNITVASQVHSKITLGIIQHSEFKNKNQRQQERLHLLILTSSIL